MRRAMKLRVILPNDISHVIEWDRINGNIMEGHNSKGGFES